MIVAGATNLFFNRENNIVPRAAFLVAMQAGIVALTKAIKVVLSRVVLQSAKYQKSTDGDIAVTHTLAQGLVHRLVYHGDGSSDISKEPSL